MLEKIEAVSKIKDPIRIGKKGGKPRPLRVIVPDQSERRKILSKASTLAKVEELSKKIYIKRDMTQREKQTFKKLVEERDSKRREATEKGEKDVVWSIWRGKVVKRKPPQPETD